MAFAVQSIGEEVVFWQTRSITSMIKVSAPSIGIHEQEAAAAVIHSGWIGHGARVLAFEETCRNILHSKYFIAVSSCTKAIEVALICAGCLRGDEIILPSLTYVSVVQVLLKLGLVPVFADVEEENLNISLQDIQKKITKKTRFILPLHYRGCSCNMEDLTRVAQENNLHIIEDAAHAFGNYYNGKPIGTSSFAACFSFGALKNFSCIEGGGIATNDDELAKKIMQYRNLGMERSTWQRYSSAEKGKPWEYSITGAGDKCTMNDVCAAVGKIQLERKEEIFIRKKTLLRCYMNELSNINGLTLMPVNDGEDLLYIFPILVNEDLRMSLMQYLLDRQISTAIHYHPNHLQPYFKEYRKENLPVTESVCKRIMTLPFYTDMTEIQHQHVIETIKQFFDNHS